MVIDPITGNVDESWTGYQVAWHMARGYPGAFGRMVNAPWIWLPLCGIFVLGLLDWRRPFRLAHLDLLVIVAGFGLSHYFFNRGNIGLSVPLAYPPLLYLLARALWLGFRRKQGSGLRPTMPIVVLAVMTVVLIAGRTALNVLDSNVIDVGYSGVIGADRIADRKPIYDNFPSDDQSGDTYGPVAYYAYVPFEQAFPGAAPGTTCPPPTRPRSSSTWPRWGRCSCWVGASAAGAVGLSSASCSASPGPPARTPPTRWSRTPTTPWSPSGWRRPCYA